MNVIERHSLNGRHETRHGPAAVVYGAGSLQALGAELDRIGAQHPFLVTTRSLVREGELLGRVQDQLGDRLVGTFGESDAHAPRPTVIAVAQLAKEAGADCLVAFGGGSVTDTCRGAVIAYAENIVDPAQFDAYKVSFNPFVGTPVGDGFLPIIGLPTACSGGEFSNGCGLEDPATGTKGNYINDRLALATVILDPELTVATPDQLWSSSVVKTMSDVLEMVTAGIVDDPVADATALRAISGFHSNLAASIQGDLEARMSCQLSTWIGFSPLMSRGFEAVFTIGAVLRHQLGAYFHASHGEIAAVLLPHVLRFELRNRENLARPILEAMSVDVSRLTDDEAVDRLVEEVSQLASSVNMPSRLREIGADAEAFDKIAKTAGAILTQVTPATEEDLVALLAAAY